MSSYKIKPIIPLTVNLADGRRRFILVCGAGVSKDAGVPSGWDILVDTISKIHQQELKKKKFDKKEGEEWYLQNENLRNMTYSKILDLVYPGMEQKRIYLNSFFKGRKPGKVHKTIARMVKEGLVRFIITTNFDNLIEKALDVEGLEDEYSVISTNDQAKNCDTWDKVETCRIYKLHGDKDQGPIRNSLAELEQLDEYIEKDFQELINRHGVIVVGYAGRDEGVMRCFEKREYHRYPLYWQFRDNLNKRVKILIQNQDGVLMHYERASEFLNELLDRVRMARSISDTDTMEVIRSNYEQLLIKNNPIEIKARIDEEKTYYLRNVHLVYESLNQNANWQLLWDAHTDLIEKANRDILLGEQLLKFGMSRDWEEFIKIFEEIHSINQTQDRYGRDGLINYLLFSLFLAIGSRALAYKSFNEIKKLFLLRKLHRDRMEYILDWNMQASYIQERNQSEPSRFFASKVHYLLDLVEAKKFPLDQNELRKSILEFDLLCFIYKAKKLEGGYSFRWHPGCAYYYEYEVPLFLEKIRLDDDYCEKIANQLFDEPKDVLRASLIEVKKIYGSLNMEGWPDNPFRNISPRQGEQTVS